MDYLLTEEQIMIRDLARQIAVEKIVPVRAELDEQNKFPTDIMKAMAQADLFGIYIPEEYGGLGKKSLELYIAIEELSKACLGVSTSYAANALGTLPHPPPWQRGAEEEISARHRIGKEPCGVRPYRGKRGQRCQRHPDHGKTRRQ